MFTSRRRALRAFAVWILTSHVMGLAPLVHAGPAGGGLGTVPVGLGGTGFNAGLIGGTPALGGIGSMSLIGPGGTPVAGGPVGQAGPATKLRFQRKRGGTRAHFLS